MHTVLCLVLPDPHGPSESTLQIGIRLAFRLRGVTLAVSLLLPNDNSVHDPQHRQIWLNRPDMAAIAVFCHDGTIRASIHCSFVDSQTAHQIWGKSISSLHFLQGLRLQTQVPTQAAAAHALLDLPERGTISRRPALSLANPGMGEITLL